MDHDTRAERQLLELSEEDCWTLIASAVVGRLAWSGGEGITVVPVNFSLDGHTVRVRTAAYSALARECDDSPVAFEVDRYDPITRAGWSVLIRGHAHIDFDAQDDETEVDVWLSGPRPLHVHLEAAQISGRRVHGDS
ncbi:pyridoxamine 5'-phosphate oxidase family protein [soil metagenome]